MGAFLISAPTSTSDHSVKFSTVTYALTKGDVGAVGLVWRGAYNAGTTYVIRDAVSLAGSSYYAIAISTGKDPATETAYWSLLAVKGDTGAAGGSLPIGTIIRASQSPGAAWLRCDGSVYLQGDGGKPLLYAQVGILPHLTGWTETDADEEHAPQRIAFGNARFVMVKSYYVKYSEDYGATWVDAMSGGTLYKFWRGVAYSANLAQWCAVATAGELWTSADNGTTWTSRTSSFEATDIYAVTWAGEQWIACGAAGKIATSPDGITWTQRTGAAGAAGELRGVAWSVGQSIAAIVDNTGGNLQTSPDGVTWTARITGTVGIAVMNDVCYAAGIDMFFATGCMSMVLRSRTGKDWAVSSMSPQTGATWDIIRVGTDGYRALVMMRNGQMFWVFEDGSTRPAPSYFAVGVDVGGVAAGGGRWAIGGRTSNNRCAAGISSYNLATSFRLPSPALDAGIFSDSWILGDS